MRSERQGGRRTERSTHPGACGLAKVVCTAVVTDGEGAEGVDDVCAGFVWICDSRADEVLSLDGGLYSEEVL